MRTPVSVRLAAVLSLAAAIAAAAPAMPAYADDSTGTVTGHLLDGTTPVSDVAVTLVLPTNGDVATTTTDTAGAFTLADVPPGDYLVRFDLPGSTRDYYHHSNRYDEGTQTISVTGGAETTVEETIFAHGSVT